FYFVLICVDFGFCKSVFELFSFIIKGVFMLKFYNTLTGTLEEFQPLESGKVRMYVCGPTVWSYAHIGNFRTFTFEDVLRRYLKYKGYELNHVMNLTDVDDRIINE